MIHYRVRVGVLIVALAIAVPLAVPAAGSAAALKLYPSRADGTSLAFAPPSTLASLPSGTPTPTAVRAAIAVDTSRGWAEFVSASNTDERTPHGGIYWRLRGGPLSLFRAVRGVKLWPMPGFLAYKSGSTITYRWYSMRLNSRRECSIWIGTYDARLRLRSERKLIGQTGWTYQSYRVVRTRDGRVVMPVVYARDHQIYTGPWRLRVYESSDAGRTWRHSASTGYPGRGLLEPQPYIRHNGTVGIFCRTDRGHLATAKYYPGHVYLSRAHASPFRGNSTGCSISTLPGGKAMLSYCPGPREFVAAVVTSNDFLSFDAIHVVSTAPSLATRAVAPPVPFVHQPRIETHHGDPVTYTEEVRSEVSIRSWSYARLGSLSTSDTAIASADTTQALHELAELDVP